MKIQGTSCRQQRIGLSQVKPMCFRLQGNADLDGDGAIKVAELHEYIKGRVTKSSAFEQTPELQGDAERVLVRFQ
jgi:hypothetical protein